MTDAKHTPTPWCVSNGKLLRVSGTKNPPITICGVHRVGSRGGTQQCDPLANAHRIVACVNACEGIPSSALESGVIGELVEALEGARAYIEKDEVAHGRDFGTGNVIRAALLKARGGSDMTRHPAELMLSEAVDGLHASPDATARAIGYALHRRHGDDASRLADLVVGAVQDAQRAPRMPAPDYEIDLTPPTDRGGSGMPILIVLIGVVVAALIGTVAIPAPPPIETGPGYEICTTEGC